MVQHLQTTCLMRLDVRIDSKIPSCSLTCALVAQRIARAYTALEYIGMETDAFSQLTTSCKLIRPGTEP
jgi:hypothetical protein